MWLNFVCIATESLCLSDSVFVDGVVSCRVLSQMLRGRPDGGRMAYLQFALLLRFCCQKKKLKQDIFELKNPISPIVDGRMGRCRQAY